MSIRLLPPTLINQIAAGEVIERPAAAVKELVENAIDAGASRIEIVLVDGGKALIRVKDDGYGMGPEDLALAVERHCTSKLPADDLVHIRHLGFRGEALPSIGSVSRLRLTSRRRGAETAWALAVEGGEKGQVEPASLPHGTMIEVRDLFFATPARLKFLKTARSELGHVVDHVERLAMAYPRLGFSVQDGERMVLKLPACQDIADESARLTRLSGVLGRDFQGNALPVLAERDGMRLYGHIGVPTYNKGNAQSQYLFVNHRPVKDRLLAGAVKGAYSDFLAHDRYPVVALFLELPAEEVDVNVHPAKAEVRFRDSSAVRGLIVGALKHALAEGGHRASTTIATHALGAFRPASPIRHSQDVLNLAFHAQAPILPSTPLSASSPAISVPFLREEDERAAPQAYSAPASSSPDPLLGRAKAQLHRTYILAETNRGLVLVDQHAAHERLVYERMKEALAQGGVKRQMLLIPEVVELDERACDRILSVASSLAELGLVVQPFGSGAVVVQEVPALLGTVNTASLIRDLVDDLEEWGEALSLKDRLADICGTMACHASIRAGRDLSLAEMDALLRQMEETPHSGQCNHGRPTYIELQLPEIEKLFGRR